jgi:adenylosuccinate lyase
MIARYTRPEMGRIWSDQNKYRQWLEVELAASEALAELGVVPAEAAAALRAHAGFDASRIDEIEAEVKHDVIAFTTSVAETMAKAGARRGVALAPLRADVERRGGHRAGAAAEAGFAL